MLNGRMSDSPVHHPASVEVLVAHGNALLAAGVLSVLGPAMRGAVVPATELAQQVLAQRPGLLVTDYANGLRLLAKLGRVPPPLLVLDDRMAAVRVRLALDAGVRGFVGADCPLPVLLQAAQALVHGQPYLCEHAAATLAEAAALTPLTPREHEVLALLCQGLNNKTIALQLNMALGTVKTHVKAILGKLAVGSRTQAAAAARQLGLLSGRETDRAIPGGPGVPGRRHRP